MMQFAEEAPLRIVLFHLSGDSADQPLKSLRHPRSLTKTSMAA